MGLPVINIKFVEAAITAIQRSQRGVVAIILKDDGVTGDSFVYTSIEDITESWTDANLDFIKKAFLGTPNKIIVERLATSAGNINDALTRLENKLFNYVCVPGGASQDQTDLSTWVKTSRATDHKIFKAVVGSVIADDEGVINFTTTNIKVGDDTYNDSQYTSRIAGLLAGLPFTRSSTYFVLPEVESITESSTPNDDIDAGKLILINDGEKIKIGRGVNSLTTTTATKGPKFKKIKIIEALDLIRYDIRKTFEDEYVGQVNNKYTNKILLVNAINAYFRGLQGEDILDPSVDAICSIDIEATKEYLRSKGIDVDDLTDQQIKEYNTDDKVFLEASGSPLDAMEELEFNMYLI